MRKYLLSVAVFAAFAIAAAPAQAVTINPAGEAFTSFASNTVLSYGSGTVQCDNAVANGTTANPLSDVLTLSNVDFSAPCSTSTGHTVVSVVEDLNPAWTLKALTSTGNGNGTGVVNIPNGAGVTITTSGFLGNCKITVLGPQTAAGTLNSALQTLQIDEANLNANAVSTGSTGCALTSNDPTTGFKGTYAITSTNDISIQP